MKKTNPLITGTIILTVTGLIQEWTVAIGIEREIIRKRGAVRGSNSNFWEIISEKVYI